MTAAISYESDSSIIESDDDARLHVDADGGPRRKYVRIHEADGTIRLVPLDHLHESERAILENPSLYQSVRMGLKEAASGQRVSSDWLFEDSADGE
ncbi:hypothetical protein [Gordonia sp. SCSIO 19800]|uniref:hypothetical protein n=1 Tax=Gordonia sp. SCSIO 19800 TaxID=2826926 RepID=UPI001B82795E|nr:hypothetical protein [Gordonia sp. SCSIO 19800]MBR7191909.1 hypothetical protein [Gordonia sp. SCSIO 19800]